MKAISKHHKIFAAHKLLVANFTKSGFGIKLKQNRFVLFALKWLYILYCYLDLISFFSLYRREDFIEKFNLAKIIPVIQDHTFWLPILNKFLNYFPLILFVKF
jgi:hypothetical protein